MGINLKFHLVISFKDLEIQVPHPVDFAIHKIIVSTKRRDKSKAKKDISQAMEMIQFIKKNPILVKILEEKIQILPKVKKMIESI